MATRPTPTSHRRPAARAIALRRRLGGLSRHTREELVLGLLALVAGVEIFRFALRVTEDVMLSLMAPVFCFLLLASLMATSGSKGH
jgi:hypothetical protein